MEKKVQILIGLLLIAAIIGYNYIYKNHRDIAAEKSQLDVSTDFLSKEFSKDLDVAETKFLNTVITLSGKISETNAQDITIDDKVFCQLLEKPKVPLPISQYITIKGRVIGYDDLLQQIKLDQCTIVKH